ncbi:MAG: V-type ATP synthase subunit D [Chlamydiae bacterium]|jgi:V/A-type H+-transporting ATPase subunit D|nr:V-type ATP synthase subunit D [Chlamydiota bacterium]
MARLKCTKIELVRLKKKLGLFRKYLPTLQLKKMLLQSEVNKAKDELKRLREIYELEKKETLNHAHLFDDPVMQEIEKAFEVGKILTSVENIAGIKVPVLEKLEFMPAATNLMKTPLWVDTIIEIVRELKHTYQKVILGIKKKEILEEELRVVSIRVNLFEKRLIPELENNINQIRIFIGDQELQAVAQAKVSKNKILKRKMSEEGMVS